MAKQWVNTDEIIPPHTGEWTSVGGDLNTGTTEIFTLGKHRAKTIADAHNAALRSHWQEGWDTGVASCAPVIDKAQQDRKRLADESVILAIQAFRKASCPHSGTIEQIIARAIREAIDAAMSREEGK